MIDTSFLIKKASEIGITIDEIAAKKFDIYADMLVNTNKTLNLTSIIQPEDIVIKHFADSLTLLNYINPKQGASLIDVGTGAGLPGMALKIIRPDLKITLVDSTLKKLNFINNVAEAIGSDVETVHGRAEELGKKQEYREHYDFACARAVANMTILSEYCLPFVKVGGIFAAMKSAKANEEISSAEKAIELLSGKLLSVNSFNLFDSGERCIICIKKISHTPPKYPRASAQISKKPIE